MKKFTGPNEILLVLGWRTNAHCENCKTFDKYHSVTNLLLLQLGHQRVIFLCCHPVYWLFLYQNFICCYGNKWCVMRLIASCLHSPMKYNVSLLRARSHWYTCTICKSMFRKVHTNVWQFFLLTSFTVLGIILMI